MATYHDRYIDKLNSLSSIKDKDVAVLGCSYGIECKKLIEAGANSVMGFDLDPKIGKDFIHSHVSYRFRSVTDTGEPTGVFDIVYSAAVFEHVHDLPGAMKEAVRICKPGGLIFILSSPLWYAPYGNHMISKLEPLPWCHLIFSPSGLRNEIVKYVPTILDQEGELDRIIDRIFDPTYFNRLPPSVYKHAADQLSDVLVIENNLWPAAVKPEYSSRYLPVCTSKGFVAQDLMIGAHFYCAKKNG